MSARNFSLGLKAAGGDLKFDSLNFLETYGPTQAYTGIFLLGVQKLTVS